MSPTLEPLPYDILVQIVSLAPRTTWPTLCLVCRDFRQLLVPRLYHVADFGEDDSDRACQFLTTISSAGTGSQPEHLGSFVCRLSIISLPDSAIPIFVPALRNMPNVQHFCCKRLGAIASHDQSVLDVIASLRALRSFDTVWTARYDWGGLLERLPPLEALTVDAGSGATDALERLLLRSRHTLQALDTQYWEMKFFLREQARLGTHSIVWPHVTELRPSSLSALTAAAFPNLETLYLPLTHVSEEAMHVLSDPSALRRLRQLCLLASKRLASAASQWKRRLSHLHVDVRADCMSAPRPLLASLSAFSWEHLHSLQYAIDGDRATLEGVVAILPALLAGCTQLAFLAVTYDYWRRMNDPSPFLRVIDTLNGMPASVHLPKLRYLVLAVVPKPEGVTQTEFAAVIRPVAVAMLFRRAPALETVQCQLEEAEMSWTRRSFEEGVHQVSPDRLPTGLANVVRLLEL